MYKIQSDEKKEIIIIILNHLELAANISENLFR